MIASLPQGWVVKKLGGVCLPITKLDPAATGRETVRYVDIGSVDGDSHTVTTVGAMRAREAPSRARQLLAAGDTVFATVRPYLEKVAYIATELDGEFASTGFCVLRPGPDLLPRYLFHFATSRQLLGQVLPHQRGVSYPAVLNRDVLGSSIPVPPLEEQRRIVDILDDHLSRLDAAAESLGSAIRKSGALLVALQADCVAGGGLGSGQRTAVGFGSAVLEIPNEWNVVTLGDVAQSVEYGIGVKAHEHPVEGDIPILRMGNIQRGRIDWGSLKYVSRDLPGVARLVLAPGDLLFNRTNSAEQVGKSAVVPNGVPTATFASYLIRTRLPAGVNPNWVSMVINSVYGRSHIASVVSQQVGQANVNGTKLRAFPLPLPDLPTQNLLVVKYESDAEANRRLQESAAIALARNRRLRTSLLTAALSGRLTGASSDVDRVEELAGV